MTPTVTGIHVHPIKSCAGVALDKVSVSATGLHGDRMFQVVDAEGAPITQRQQPVLATVRPHFVEGGLAVEADGRAVLTVTTPTVNDTTVTSLLGVPLDAADAGPDAADWFGDLLGVPARLVAMTATVDYQVPFPGIDMRLSWADAAAVLVANDASLHWLTDRSSEDFGMDRFRPNITVDAGEAWVEDTWRDFSIGDARFGLGIAWPRCSIAQVDQVDGTRHKEPAKVLKAHRWCADASSQPEALRPLFEGSALFGVGCSAGPVGAEIRLGDVVTVHATGNPIIPAP